MALATGLQSLAFYVLACTPCYQVATMRQEKKKAKRDLRARAILEKERPDMYMHPLPQQTNVFWSEEINLGPTFNKAGAASEKSRALLGNSSKDSISASTARIGTSGSGPNVFDSSSETALDSVADSESNHKKTRYERIEEEIWGHELLGKVGDAVSNVGKNVSHASKKMSVALGIDKNETVDKSDDDDIRMPNNPPVNEYHPPIVTNRPTKRAYQWMLQPPPPAKFMDGRSTVSRAPSTASVGTVGTNGSRSTHRRNKGSSPKSRDPRKTSPPSTPTPASMSEADLINSVLGQPKSRAELIKRPETADSGSSSDIEVVKQRRRTVRSNTAKGMDTGGVSGNATPEHRRRNLSHSSSVQRTPRHERDAAKSYEPTTPMTMSSTAPVLPHVVV
ncbi:hypothetical protein Cpir12675_006826 [Ceratocystis pirilliformis]|uniref:Signal peptide-containing protein n=1 Tax=Ceratocystis pirilliformis TaxID=259994 RepID=A0ABR3YF60_9PEZI